ncbi:hypothetical protein KDK_10360 [Dictyobacter kobayashii]|uniref:Uncharacterized protein n=1 Tax=Dictyobacter kobayashii TaxID=2014872 RepID=A0A402ADS1_9CHLR|nr:hypothetical protein KDK_10360 [Dictyobacter kobayashii]
MQEGGEPSCWGLGYPQQNTPPQRKVQEGGEPSCWGLGYPQQNILSHAASGGMR